MTILALLKLLELLLWELSTSGHEDILKEINQTISKLQETAKNQQSFTLEIEIALMQSQLVLIQGNFHNANEILRKAEEISKKHQFENHNTRIHEQQHQINNELSKWERMTKQNASLIEKIQESSLTEFIESAQQYIDTGFSAQGRIGR